MHTENPRRLKQATVALLLLAPALCGAAADLDQEYVPTNNLGSLEITATQPVAQTFTVGRDGFLDAIELPLKQHRCPATDDLVLEIHAVTGGLPSRATLLSEKLKPRDLPAFDGAYGPVVVPLRGRPVPVKKASQLAIVLVSKARGGGCTFAWNGDVPGNYAGGTAVIFNQPNPRDMGFKTFVRQGKKP